MSKAIKFVQNDAGFKLLRKIDPQARLMDKVSGHLAGIEIPWAGGSVRPFDSRAARELFRNGGTAGRFRRTRTGA